MIERLNSQNAIKCIYLPGIELVTISYTYIHDTYIYGVPIGDQYMEYQLAQFVLYSGLNGVCRLCECRFRFY